MSCKALKIQLGFVFKPRKNANKLKTNETYSTRTSTGIYCMNLNMEISSYLHAGVTFSHALSSLPLCLVSTSAFSLPSDPPPGEKEGKRAKYQIQTLSSSSSSSTTLIQNNSSNPKRAPESYWTWFCAYVRAHVDVCAASVLDQDAVFILLALVPPFNCQEILKHAI